MAARSRWIVLGVVLMVAAVSIVWIVVENRASEKLLAAAAGLFVLPLIYYVAHRFLPECAEKLVAPFVAVFSALVVLVKLLLATLLPYRDS